jgi:hypothetical protein
MSMNHFKAWVFVALTASASAAWGVTITRYDTLECTVKAGGKFVMRAKYKWDPVAAMIPADVKTTEYDPAGFQIQYIDAKGKKSAAAPYGSGYNGGLYEGSAVNYCKHVGVIKGVPTVSIFFLKQDGTWSSFWMATLPKKLYLSSYKDELGEPWKSQLATQMLSPGLDKIIPLDGRLVYECALYDMNPQTQRKDDFNIAAVFQSFSSDGGNTWSDPVITTDSKLFEFGKSVREQSWAGYPSRINGKRFEPAR